MKIAVITGASSGMGRRFSVLANFYYPEIDEVWLIGRDLKKLYRTAARIDIKTRVFSLDLTDGNDIDMFMNLLEDVQPEIKLLVNSAGVGIFGRFDKLSMKDANEMLDINCKALTDMIHLSLPYMMERSHIINMASAAAFICQSEFAIYAASKSYVLSLSDALSKELRPRKIFVTAVCPGTVNTPFIESAQKYQKIKAYKKFFMVNERAVVNKALWDSKRRRTRSIYGIPMKLFYIACKFLPLKILLKFA